MEANDIKAVQVKQCQVILLPFGLATLSCPCRKVTSVTTMLPFAHEQRGMGDLFGKAHWRFSKSHPKNRSVDCSRIPSAYHTLLEKYAGVVEESPRLRMKERVEENETVGTWVEGEEEKGGEREWGRQREKGDCSLLIPPHLASIRMWGPLK